MATNNAVNTGLSGATGTGSFVGSTSATLVTPALGTPTAGVLSSCTGYPTSALTGLGTGVATFLATPSSANLAAALTDETGSGAAVFANTPTLVTPVLGAATATSVAFNPTTGGIIGTTTNDNTAAGKVGEFSSSVIAGASGVSLTNNTVADVTSVSLTAGDWDVWGNITFVSNTGTRSYGVGWVSSTSVSQPDAGSFVQIGYSSTGNNDGLCVLPIRVSLSGTTTVYLSTVAGFTVGLKACGGIYARRRR